MQSMSVSTTSRVRQALTAIAAAALMVASLAAFPTPSEARVGDVRAVPSFYGTGTVALDGSYNGRVSWYLSSGDKCLYVQVKHVAVLGTDSTWDRLTSNDCTRGGGTMFAYWNKPTTRAFNGYKFRLCRDQWGLDSCGASVTIYR